MRGLPSVRHSFMAVSARLWPAKGFLPKRARNSLSKVVMIDDSEIIGQSPPRDRKAIHQGIDVPGRVVLRVGGEVGVLGGSEDRVVAEAPLHIDEVNAGLDQIGGITVAKTVRGDLFFNPHSSATLRKAI